MEAGKFYLFATPWFWTWVGRFERYVNFDEIEICDGGYFTLTGATFDVLASKGLQDKSSFHATVAPKGAKAKNIISSKGAIRSSPIWKVGARRG